MNATISAHIIWRIGLKILKKRFIFKGLNTSTFKLGTKNLLCQIDS